MKSLGADHVIDYTNKDFTQNGKIYDIIFDAVGMSSFSRCKNSLKPGGIYLTMVPTLADLLQWFWSSIAGGKEVSFAATGLRSANAKAEDQAFISKNVASGKIKAIIERRFPLKQMAEAHRYVETGHKEGVVVITVVHNNEL